MCLRTDFGSRAKVAEEDIPVFKLMVTRKYMQELNRLCRTNYDDSPYSIPEDEEYQWFTPYRHVPMRNITECKYATLDDPYAGFVNSGFHSFVTEAAALEVKALSRARPSRMSSDIRDSEIRVLKAFIPKGSNYVEGLFQQPYGDYRSYASDALQFYPVED